MPKNTVKLRGLSPFLLGIVSTSCAVFGLGSLRHCPENIVPLPEPAGWRDWPREKAYAASGYDPGSLFGYKFNYETLEIHPMPAGIVNTHLIDPKLCLSSSVTLNAWFSGDRWWTRGPGQLTLHRGPKEGLVVISGLSIVEPETSVDTFVVAFARRPDGWRVSDQVPVLPLYLAAVVGLVGLGFAAWRPKFQRAVLWTAWLGVAACVLLRAQITELLRLRGGLISAFFH